MNLMNALLLSCVDATRLMEIKEYMPVGLMRKLQLGMHVGMCAGCRNYMKQTKLINKLLQRGFSDFGSVTDTHELEAAIISKLN